MYILAIVAKSVGHKTKKTVSTVEQLDLEISEKQLQVILNNFPGTYFIIVYDILYIHVVLFFIIFTLFCVL